MPLHDEVKKYLSKWLGEASDAIDRKNFGFLARVGDRAEALSEMHPDEVWSKELVFISMTLSILGATAAAHFDDLTDKRKEELKIAFKKYLEEIKDGLAAEDNGKIHNSLRDSCAEAYRAFYLGR